jgi:glycosyltransferase involved in cell wall biosynthesis
MALVEVSIIIPVFSELDSVNQTVEQLLSSFNGLPIEIIIIAHPKSKPDCLQNCSRLAGTIPSVQFQIQKQLPGQGLAYRQAIELCQGRFIMLMNADLETHPPDARRLYDAITQQNYDVVVASRWCKGAVFDAKTYGRFKIILNYVFQRIFAAIFFTSITDLSFCYKIARADIYKSLRWTGTQHEFALETTLVPIALGMRVGQIPTTWRRRSEGASNFNFWRSIRHVKLALAIIRSKVSGVLADTYKQAP